MKQTGKKLFTAARVLGFVVLAGLLLAGCPDNVNDDDDRPQDVLIWQAYGGDGRNNGTSHHFVELYNTSEKDVNLSGWHLWYSGSHKFFNEDPLNVTEDQDLDTEWENIALTGTIPAKSSYLILGEKTTASTWWRISMEDGEGDINKPEFWLHNRGFKIALIQGNFQLNDSIQNPFNTDGKGTKVPGYVDMVGAINSVAEGDRLYGYEGPTLNYSDPANFGNLEYARCSAQEAIRRRSLTDTDNNYNDFQSMRYTTKHLNPDGTVFHVNGVEDSECADFKPKNTEHGPWDPIITRAIVSDDAGGDVAPDSETLMILMANTYGNDNGLPYAPTGGGFANSMVELYNNTNATIDLNVGNYYLHIGTNTGWTYQIKLTGSVPAHCSYLIVADGSGVDTDNATPRAILPAADQTEDFTFINNDFVVAILKNQSGPLTGNPFGNASLASDYVDMLGCRNAVGKETNAASNSRPQPPRRKSLADTDDNSADFAQVDLRGRTSSNGMDDNQLYKVWPRNVAAGAWDPIEGTPVKHPVITE